MDAVDHIAFLAGSEPRAAVLAALSREDGLSRDDLVERCGAARVTVNRNLEQLGDRGLVASRDGGWRLTPLGELLATDFLALAETVETGEELAPVLRRLPGGEFDLDPAALAGAKVTASTAANPYAPVQRHEETLLAADRARLVLPAVSPRLVEETGERLRTGALEMEIVASAAVAETFRTEIVDAVSALAGAGALELLEYGGRVPFYLGLVDDGVQVGVADEEGIPRALAETGDETVRSWAESTYESYRSGASPFEVDDALD